MTLSESNITGSIACPAVPPKPGVYFVTDDAGAVLYVGESKHLRRRIAHLFALQADKNQYGFSHLKAQRLHEAQVEGRALHVHYLVTDDHKRVEKEMIAKYRPLWNEK